MWVSISLGIISIFLVLFFELKYYFKRFQTKKKIIREINPFFNNEITQWSYSGYWLKKTSNWNFEEYINYYKEGVSNIFNFPNFYEKEKFVSFVESIKIYGNFYNDFNIKILIEKYITKNNSLNKKTKKNDIIKEELKKISPENFEDFSAITKPLKTNLTFKQLNNVIEIEELEKFGIPKKTKLEKTVYKYVMLLYEKHNIELELMEIYIEIIKSIISNKKIKKEFDLSVFEIEKALNKIYFFLQNMCDDVLLYTTTKEFIKWREQVETEIEIEKMKLGIN